MRCRHCAAVSALRCGMAVCYDCAGFRTVLRVRRRCGRGEVHRWRRKRGSSPLVKAKPEIVAMGGDAVWALRCVMAVCDDCAGFRTVLRVRRRCRRGHVHRWRRERALSPLVKAKPEIVAMGGDAVWALRCVMAVGDDCFGFRMVCGARSGCGRGHVLRYALPRCSSPLVKAKPEIVAMGGDAVWALRCVMAVCDDYAGFRTVLRVRRRCGRGHVHRWRQKRGSSPLVKAKPEIVAMGGDAVWALRCVMAVCDDCAGFRTVLRVRRRCGRGRVEGRTRERASRAMVECRPEI